MELDEEDPLVLDDDDDPALPDDWLLALEWEDLAVDGPSPSWIDDGAFDRSSPPSLLPESDSPPVSFDDMPPAPPNYKRAGTKKDKSVLSLFSTTSASKQSNHGVIQCIISHADAHPHASVAMHRTIPRSLLASNGCIHRNTEDYDGYFSEELRCFSHHPVSSRRRDGEMVVCHVFSSTDYNAVYM